MTKNKTSKIALSTIEHKKLSIQVSLNGLSFSITDSVNNSAITTQHLSFERELTPFQVQKKLETLITEHGVDKAQFESVRVIHNNNLFALVPAPLFQKDQLAQYLKYNAKILENDLLAFDEIERHDLYIVYVPLVNINNYIFDLFGEFEFEHQGCTLLQNILDQHSGHPEHTCYVYCDKNHMDVIILKNKKLQLYNHFQIQGQEDFMYYLLFALEQLELDTEKLSLRLMGAVEEGDDLYKACTEFITHVAVFELDNVPDFFRSTQKNIDLTTLK